VLDKCERKGVRDLESLADVVGARVVCLFRSDMSRVAKVLEANFDVVSVDDKLTDAGPLGYQSTHYVCELPGRYSGPRYENTAGVKFEIQVRTLCMHAWAAVSHHLDYKGDWDVPKELKQALSALGGLFYVADNEFEQFYSARQKSKREAEQSIVADDEEQELNLDTATSYMMQKFKDRKQYGSGSLSKLVKELKAYGYKTILDVDKMIDRGEEAFRAYEKKYPPASGRFSAEGVVRVTDRIVHKRKTGEVWESEFVRLVRPE
jgi:putative GTP pyrophosphokinase